MTTIGQGLTFAGASLARAIMERKAQKKQQDEMAALLQALAAQPEQMPGYGQNMELANVLIPQAPLKQLSPMDPSKDPSSGVNYMDAKNNIKSMYEREAAEQNALMAALMQSGNPQMQQMALSMSPKAPKPPQKPMSVSGGYLDSQGQFHRTEQVKPDYSRFDVIDIGGVDKLVDYSRLDDEGKPMVLAEGADLKDKDEVWTDAGNNMEQGWIRDPRSQKLQPMQLPDGSPALRSSTKKIQQTNIEGEVQGSLAGNDVWLRKMQTDVSTAYGAATRVGRVAERFDPFYQSWAGKMTKLGLEAADKWIPTGLPEGKSKDLLKDIAQFEQDTNANVNLYIKEITGAQMSEAEAQRLSKAVANLGDSPTVFKAKMENTQRVLKEAAAIIEEEMRFYGNLRNPMDYDEALKYAKKKAAAYISNGIDEFNKNTPGALAEPGSAGPGFDPPEGYEWSGQNADGVWQMKPKG